MLSVFESDVLIVNGAHFEEWLAKTLENEIVVGVTTGQEIGGVRMIAEVLNKMGRASESAIMQAMEDAEPELAAAIRNLMFTFDDIVRLDDRSLQEILREVKSEDLARAMKLVDEGMREKFYKNMSKRGAEMLKEELDLMPPTRLSEAARPTKVSPPSPPSIVSASSAPTSESDPPMPEITQLLPALPPNVGNVIVAVTPPGITIQCAFSIRAPTCAMRWIHGTRLAAAAAVRGVGPEVGAEGVGSGAAKGGVQGNFLAIFTPGGSAGGGFGGAGFGTGYGGGGFGQAPERQGEMEIGIDSLVRRYGMKKVSDTTAANVSSK